MTQESPSHKYNTRASRRQEGNDGLAEETAEEFEPFNEVNEEEINEMTQENIEAAMDQQPSRKYLNRKIEVLDELTPKKVKEFQHSFQYTNAIGSRRTMMTKDVLESIEAEGVDIMEEKQISDYLDKIVNDDLKDTTKSGFKYMKRNLKWPKNGENLTNKINTFIRDAQRLKKYVKNYETEKRVKEDVFKLIKKKLPYQFGIKKELIKEKPELLELKALGKELKLRGWALETKRPRRKRTIKRLEREILRKLKAADLTDDDSESDTETDEPTTEEEREPTSKKKYVRRARFEAESNSNETEAEPSPEGAEQQLNNQVNRLTTELSTPKCYECGQTDHFRAQCPHRNKDNNRIMNNQLTGNINAPPINNNNQHQVTQGTNVQLLQLMNQMNSALQNLNPYGNRRGSAPRNAPREKTYKINRLAVGTILPRAKLHVKNPAGAWVQVPGILDSGSGTTVGSLQHHKHLFASTNPVRNVVKISLINNEQYLAREAGHVRLKVIDINGTEREFQEDVLVFLVDSPAWRELIVGYPTLRKEGLVPEQHLQQTRNN